MNCRIYVVLVVAAILTVPSAAQEKKQLDHDAYAVWNRITEKSISSDGNWLSYSMSPEDEDGVLVITNPTNNRQYTIPRGEKASFSRDASAVAFLMSPPNDSTRNAKRNEVKKDEMPGDSLGLIRLTSGDLFARANVNTFKMPEENGDWIAYQIDKRENPEIPKDSTETENEDDDAEEKEDKPVGSTLVLRNHSSGSEASFNFVTEFLFFEDGEHLVFSKSSEEPVADGVFVVNTQSGRIDTVNSGTGVYKNLAVDKTGKQLAFVSNDETFEDDHTEYVLHHYVIGDGKSRVVARSSEPGIPEDWRVSENGKVFFSESGARLFFSTEPTPEPEKDDDDLLDDEKVGVEVWSWTDDEFYPAQKVNLDKNRKQSFLAVFDLKDNRIVQLADESIPEIVLTKDSDTKWAVANSNRNYLKERSWDFPQRVDVIAVNLETGERSEVQSSLQSSASLSPGGKYIVWWDGEAQAWFSKPTGKTGTVVNMSSKIPYPLYNELHDRPFVASSYGSAGWTEDDRRFIVYDRYDLWELDPSGRRSPVLLTDGVGRSAEVTYRYVRTDPDEVTIPTDKPVILSSFNRETKEGGYFSFDMRKVNQPAELLEAPSRFAGLVKATDRDRVIYTRESYEEFPDVWISNIDFSDAQKVSDANPQQDEYNWGSVELISWQTVDGEDVDGLLYKPEGFDREKTYPLMVYFYERSSDGLHSHHAPAPHRSVINRTFYASRGYLVFVPDIPYKIGYPGESAMNAVMPGVTHLIAQGFVDEDNIGVQGHSWGGYQIAYMVTKTNLFKAAEAGAPVSNMISAYGGVRWGSGLSRMFQYERTQSRIGGTLWEYPLRYISNSPIFEADRIETPLLIMHNDEDGAVPWYQGIELFAALRRLNKPVWLVNYNGEPHWPTKYQNKVDWTMRMQQYFDHFLKGEPAPEWILNGIPEIKKGKTLGYDPPVAADK